MTQFALKGHSDVLPTLKLSLHIPSMQCCTTTEMPTSGDLKYPPTTHSPSPQQIDPAPRDMSRNARSSKNCEKLEKSQFLLNLTKSSVRGSRRVSSQNCFLSNFCDFSKNCEKLEKWQFLLK